MSATLEMTEAPPSAPKGTDGDVAQRLAVDASCRVPVLFFFSAALAWLLLGSLFGFLASWKMHNPAILDDWGWLTWGRVRVAHLNMVAYGWASQAGIGVGFWLMARLCRSPLRAPGVSLVAGFFWNLGVAVGIVGILAGHSQSIEWLEMPAYATPLLFIAYALIGVWAILMFVHRRPGHVYVSQWYLLAAFLWFPWLYGTANMLMQAFPLKGVTYGAVNWWFGHNVLGLWFTPIGLASAYYMIPKVIGRPVHSYYLSALGFWTLALFYSWNGMHHLIGGPYPIWLITASVVASFMMLIPVLTVAINHHMTMRGSFGLLAQSPTLRFTVFGAMIYTLVSLQGVSMAIPAWNKITHFTHYTVGHAHLGMYGFFTMTMFGAMYYIVPRLVGCEWRSPMLIKWHFWLAAYGIVFMVLALSVGGFLQGIYLLDPSHTFKQVVEATLGFLQLRSASGIAIASAHLVFAFHFVLMLLRLGRTGGGATYFNSPEVAGTEARA